MDKYLYSAKAIDNSLHKFDAIIVNSSYMKKYFREQLAFIGGLAARKTLGMPSKQFFG